MVVTRKESSQELARNSFRLRLKQANSILFSSLLLEGGVLQIANGKSEVLDELVGPQMVLSDRSPELMPLEFAGSLVYSISVLKAFTVELYLKALLHLERKDPPWTHDLLELHGKLGFKNKQNLEEMRREVIAAPSFGGSTEVLHKDLATTLKEHRNDFKNIRYEAIPGQEFLADFSDGMINMTAAIHTCQLVCISKQEAGDLRNHVSRGFRSVLGEAASPERQEGN